MKLSVISPVYNERETLAIILSKVVAALPGVIKEIVVIDDGSTDGTREWLIKNFGVGRNVCELLQGNAPGSNITKPSEETANVSAVSVSVVLQGTLSYFIISLAAYSFIWDTHKSYISISLLL